VTRFGCTLAAVLLCALAACDDRQTPPAPGPTTEQEIHSVRVAYQTVVAAAEAHQLQAYDLPVSCGEFKGTPKVSVWIDSAGTIRQLAWSGGSGDHAQSFRFYYDAVGRLRFVYGVRGDASGTYYERRYYATDRRLLRTLKEAKRGPPLGRWTVEPLWHPLEWQERFCPKKQ
jgi:hypothetical protein